MVSPGWPVSSISEVTDAETLRMELTVIFRGTETEVPKDWASTERKYSPELVPSGISRVKTIILLFHIKNLSLILNIRVS
jgi:hypothetical protein